MDYMKKDITVNVFLKWLKKYDIYENFVKYANMEKLTTETEPEYYFTYLNWDLLDWQDYDNYNGTIKREDGELIHCEWGFFADDWVDLVRQAILSEHNQKENK